jgi:lipopolysaccharide transport system ATP-binding protein
MPDTVISVENLSKAYRLGQIGTGTLSHDLNVWWARMRGKPNPLLKIGQKDRGNRDGETIWALKDVSFEVKQGEVLGIIGRNGAGKSTLLKIITGVTAPTSGQIRAKGRVASLLEVGTGFHPELTGRENIYLNGAILGMKKAEIAHKFDEIVAFSEVEQFIDTPVKRYSSGMYVRLAFAVAAHLEPEILLVDEVLAVGDASFQKKCLGKMEDISQHGRTVLFVSHNIPAVTRICGRSIMLEEGKVALDGPVQEVTGVYLQSASRSLAEHVWSDPTAVPGNEVVCLRRARVCAVDGTTTNTFDVSRPVGIEMTYDVLKPGWILVPNYHFFNDEGVYLFVSVDLDQAWRRRPRPIGRFSSTTLIPGNFLTEGRIMVGVAVTSFEPWKIHFYERDALGFRVVDDLRGGLARGEFSGHLPGVVRPTLEWTTRVEPVTAIPEARDAASGKLLGVLPGQE